MRPLLPDGDKCRRRLWNSESIASCCSADGDWQVGIVLLAEESSRSVFELCESQDVFLVTRGVHPMIFL